MLANPTIESALRYISGMGLSMANAALPYDIEYYMVALELTDGGGNTIDYFSFPIMPSSITKTEPKRTNIKQAGSGITVISNTAFVPQIITLQGNFGKYFRFLLSTREPAPVAASFSVSNGVYNLYESSADSLIGSSGGLTFGLKNGFGSLNILRAIISKSNGVDNQGRPFRLYFYNMALSESFLVVVPPEGLRISQNLQNNGIWEYSLTLQAIAPLSLVSGAGENLSSCKRLLSPANIQKGVSDVANTASKYVQEGITSTINIL